MEYKNLNDSLNKNTIRATHNFLTNWEEPDTHMLRKHLKLKLNWGKLIAINVAKKFSANEEE